MQSIFNGAKFTQQRNPGTAQAGLPGSSGVEKTDLPRDSTPVSPPDVGGGPDSSADAVVGGVSSPDRTADAEQTFPSEGTTTSGSTTSGNDDSCCDRIQHGT
eukprot:COSAG06_NODE_306_length_17801_cov_6.989210_13_plen_102_part_00